MCIITKIVEEVNSTQIFTCFSEDQSKQFLVYSNQVNTNEENNLMILPVPNPESVEFINLQKYTKFFDDCQKNFKYVRHRATDSLLYASRSLSASIEDRPPLVIHKVGSYVASIVPSVADFDRLDPLVFDLDFNLQDILKSTYTSEFGFIACKLRKGAHTYHPFAYIHKSHSGGLLFIPTLHYHAHQYGMNKHIDADWDHIIYSIGTDLDTTNYDDYVYSPTNSIRFDKFPESIRWAEQYKLKRWTKKGNGKNRDLWIAGNLREPIHPPRPRTPSPSNREERRPRTDFPLTENGKKLIKMYFGSI